VSNRRLRGVGLSQRESFTVPYMLMGPTLLQVTRCKMAEHSNSNAIWHNQLLQHRCAYLEVSSPVSSPGICFEPFWMSCADPYRSPRESSQHCAPRCLPIPAARSLLYYLLAPLSQLSLSFSMGKNVFDVGRPRHPPILLHHAFHHGAQGAKVRGEASNT